MTPKQFRAAIAALGLSQSAAAEFLGVSLRSTHGWANDDAPIPEAVSKLLLVLSDAEAYSRIRAQLPAFMRR